MIESVISKKGGLFAGYKQNNSYSEKEKKLHDSRVREVARVVGSKQYELDYLEDYETNSDLYELILSLVSAEGFLDDAIEEVLDEYDFKFEDGIWVKVNKVGVESENSI